MDKIEVTNGAVDPDHYGPIGDAARGIASYCDDPQRVHVYTAAFDAIKDILATRTDATPVAWMYEREDGSKDLVLDCNGDYARRLIELGATETPLYPDPPATDVAALVEAAKASAEGWANAVELDLLPLRHQQTANDLQRQLRQALAPFTKGQNDG